jgi:hypothetical protein
MKRFLLLAIAFLFSLNSNAQCTISGTTVNSSSLSCASFSGCTTLYVGDGINPTTLVMTANLNFSCLGAIQFVVRNNANMDFATNNYNLTFAANSSIVVEAGGNISASTNCSASDLIYIGAIKVASCNGGGGAENDFPGLVADGGFNVINASATPICGSGPSVISAAINPTPSASTTYKWYTVATGGTAFLTTTVASNPYVTTYTTGTLSANTTYYVEATTGSLNTARKAVTVTVNALPATPSVTLTQPTCAVATGTITITAPTGSGMTYSINGSTYTNTTGIFTSVAVGTYSVTAKNSLGCISLASSATINAQPSIPVTPTLGSVVHTTCTSTTGKITISNYNAAYSYSASPSAGVSISGATITAPAGTYTVTATSGSCNSTASSGVTINAQQTDTWNGTVWSTGAPPTISQKIVFTNSFSSTTNITGCSCLVSSGTVIINSGHTLAITNDIKVTAGSITFEDGSSLVQTNDASVNSGSIIFKRSTTPLKQYDYTYWSSPVVSATLSQLATNSLFYSFSPTINNWQYQIGGLSMAQGVGYIGRAPGNLTYAPTQVVQTSFVGVPGNGVINTPIVKSTGAYNLIGNPYPSAIDIDLFITANTASTNGTIYLWTHNTAITNLQYTTNDYAKYNLTGAVRTATSAISGGALPTGKIAAGQGFFIEAKTSLANGTYSAMFNNSMRVSGNNSQFFKNASEVSSNSISEGLERHRVWLSLNNSLGAYSQMLVGYIQNATNDFDSLFDGKTMPAGNAVTLYTMVGADDLAIQGKSLPFSDADIIPIGYNTTINGELNVNLEDFDGLFDNQNVYLLDKTNNSIHDLKTAPYTFVTTAGTFENRFELRFASQALGTSNPIAVDTDVKIIRADHQLQIISPAIAIAKVEVYDILGKLLFNQNGINSNLFQTTTLNVSPQILLVKVTLDNQQSITRKTVVQ